LPPATGQDSCRCMSSNPRLLPSAPNATATQCKLTTLAYAAHISPPSWARLQPRALPAAVAEPHSAKRRPHVSASLGQKHLVARQPKCTLKGASRDPARQPCPPRLDLCLVEQPGPHIRLHVAGSIKAQQVRSAGRPAWQGVQGLGGTQHSKPPCPMHPASQAWPPCLLHPPSALHPPKLADEPVEPVGSFLPNLQLGIVEIRQAGKLALPGCTGSGSGKQWRW